MAATGADYPLRVGGRLDPQLSRWLWLVKWLLAIPHFLVLAFLWLAFLVLSVIAFVAILLTGRYPRPLFDFNVGVLRWTWRVSYYTYGALGTDRYPPFRLADDTGYPATLTLDYPQGLSRGLVLVKWLLALPHMVLVAIFVSGGVFIAASGDGDRTHDGPGLIGVLVLIAAVTLAFTGRYPQALFDFVLGLNRWVLRVAAYVGLMTDRYPPFRLDLGGEDPGAVAITPRPADGAAGPGPHPDSSSPIPGSGGAGGRPWSAGRVVALALGVLIASFSFLLFLGGAALLVVDRAGRDEAGFLGTDSAHFSSGRYAVVSDAVVIHDGGPGNFVGDELLGDIRLRVTSRTGAPIFVGIAREQYVSRYLDGVAYDEVTDLDPVEYRPHPGGFMPGLPGQRDFWTVANAGAGRQTLVWPPAEGRWVVVVMNPDGSRGVDVDADVAAELPVLTWVAVLMLIGGAVGVAIGATATVLSAKD